MYNKFSIIIPAHNEGKYISETLKSLKRINIPFEIIVICDSCIDDTHKISSLYTNFVYNVDFKNISKTRNYGVKKSTGDVLVFLDADTLVSENYVNEIIKNLEEYDYGCAKWVSGSGNSLGRYIAWISNNYSKKNIGGNFFIKKELFDKVGGFNEDMKMGEDTDLGDRLSKIGAKHCFIKNCYIIPSERRYVENGYLYLIIRSGINGFLYKYFRKYYNNKMASNFYK